MARIRTVKPEFFRHELLQDLEITHQGKYPMLVFAGLWGHCDKAGRFEWKPRTLKLDILPFMAFDMAETLTILEQAKLIERYTVEGREYGLIPSFSEHQRIGGKEAEGPEKYPAPNREATGKKRGSTREATGIAGREGKGREEEGKGERQQRSLGSRLPADWQPSELLTAWAGKERPDLDLKATIANFKDHWASASGSKGVKCDWEATFRKWVRSERPGPNRAAPDYSAVIAGLKD